MNQAFFDRAKSLNEQENNRAKAPKGVPWKLILKDNTPYHVSFLHPFNTGIDLLIHFVQGGVAICDKMYDETGEGDCEECGRVGKFGPNKPTYVRVYIGYVHDLVDTTRKSKDGTKEYKEDPVKLIEIRAGQNQANIEALQEYANKGYFNKYIWQIKKVVKLVKGQNKTSYPAPHAMHPELLGEQFTGEIPAEVIDKFSNMSQKELAQLILSSYQNVKWKDIGIDEPTYDYDFAEEPPKEGVASKALG